MRIKNLQLAGILRMMILSVLVTGCGNEPEQPPVKPVDPTPPAVSVQVPAFNPDSAYQYIKAQVDLGPRVPGTPAHAKGAEYMKNKLESFGFSVVIPSGQTVTTYDRKRFALKNVIGTFKPDASRRILLCAHWDTRPISESDPDNPGKPNDGANDGASGVGVLLEVARQVQQTNPDCGIDIIFFDLEDYGQNGGDESTWCLGSQYWAKNPHKPGYYADFGILLDMVGAPNATFMKEGISVDRAPAIVEKVWKTANRIGYGNYFLPQTRYFVGADDHVPINNMGIPCIDIIQYDQTTNAFPDYHHTHRDNMELIDKKTLKAVGQTLLEVIYNHK